MVHWELCSVNGFEPAKQWYKHKGNKVIKNQDTKTLLDLNIRIAIEARCPDNLLIDMRNSETLIIDVVIFRDFRVRNKKAKKILKYQNLALEIT